MMPKPCPSSTPSAPSSRCTTATNPRFTGAFAMPGGGPRVTAARMVRDYTSEVYGPFPLVANPFLREVAPRTRRRELSHPFEGSWLLEEMVAPGITSSVVSTPMRARGFDHRQHFRITTAHDEQGRGSDRRQVVAGQIRAPASGDDSKHILRSFCCGDQGSGRPGRSPEQPDRRVVDLVEPFDGGNDPTPSI